MREPYEEDREAGAVNEINAIVGVCREDNPADVDEAYGEGTYARLFPDEDEPAPELDLRKEYDALVAAGKDLSQAQVELTKVEGVYSSPAFITLCHAKAEIDLLARAAWLVLRRSIWRRHLRLTLGKEN